MGIRAVSVGRGVIPCLVIFGVFLGCPARAKPAECQSAANWQPGNNSDDDDRFIGDRKIGTLILLEFRGPGADEGRQRGYTTFSAPIDGLSKGARYRLTMPFKRETNGVDREVSMSVAGLNPKSRVTFRYAGRQLVDRTYTAEHDRAVVMIHMKGYMKMWSFAGLPQLCRIR